MPLSDHEQRLLDEIEQTLRSEDPVLVSSLQSARLAWRARSLMLGALAGLVGGVSLLIAGLQLRDAVGTTLGVTGFCLLVAGTECGLQALARRRAGRAPRSGRRFSRKPHGTTS